MTTGRADHRAPDGIEIRPVHGLPEFSTDSDIVGEIRRAAPWLADGDVVVITSKIISKVEGRMVAAPTDPDERDALRLEVLAFILEDLLELLELRHLEFELAQRERDEGRE